jgi:outer membrane protein assembly factor BamD
MFISVWLRRFLTPTGLVLFLGLAGCSLLPEVQDETAGWAAQKLYSEAKDNLSGGNYERVIKLYEILEFRYSYGRYA